MCVGEVVSADERDQTKQAKNDCCHQANYRNSQTHHKDKAIVRTGLIPRIQRGEFCPTPLRALVCKPARPHSNVHIVAQVSYGSTEWEDEDISVMKYGDTVSHIFPCPHDCIRTFLLWPRYCE